MANKGQQKPTISDAHNALVTAARLYMFTDESNLEEDVGDKKARMMRIASRERLMVSGLQVAAILRLAKGDFDEAKAMLEKCKLEHSRLAAFAEHEGFDLETI